jgi:hypothetical protein
MLVACALALAICAGYAAAQEPSDTLKVDYFSGANSGGSVPDGTLRLTNPGTAGGGLCAAIYVFDPKQEIAECCSCYLSPDGLRTLSVNTDLTGNPLTGVTLSTGVIKIVSSVVKSAGLCPTYPVSLKPTAGIRGWGTHIQAGGAITETPVVDATLSAPEVSRLQGQCYGIQTDGSGKGLCTCGTGD